MIGSQEFFRKLHFFVLQLRNPCCFQVISGIGDALVEHFESSGGETMKRLFGDLCCKEGEILCFYKDMLKNDKKFSSFIKVSVLDCTEVEIIVILCVNLA